MAKAVGIDLGTTNSVIAAVEGGQPTVDPQRRRVADDAVGGRVHRARASGWSASWPAGRRSSTRRARSTRPSGSSAAATTRSASELNAVSFDVVAGPGRRGPVRGPGQAVRARGDLRAGAAQAGRGRVEVPRARRSPRRSSRCPRTSTTPSARRPRTPAGSPASRCCGSSTSRPRRRWPTAWTSKRTRRCSSSTWAAAPST